MYLADVGSVDDPHVLILSMTADHASLPGVERAAQRLVQSVELPVHLIIDG